MAKLYANTAATYNNVTLPGSGASTVYTLGGGSGGTAGYFNNGATWATSATTSGPFITVGTTSHSALKVSGDADIEGNLKVRGVDLGEVLAKIQDRLAILVPDPARLEKYEALRQAYEHYKTLEALCVDETNSPK